MSRPTPPVLGSELDPGFLDHVLDTLIETIPAGDDDTGQTRAARRQVAGMAVQALCPADAFQAMLAAQAIAAHHAIIDAFSRAMQPDLAPAMAARLRANAATLARMMQATLRTLRQQQAEASDDTAAPQPAPTASRTGCATKPASSGARRQPPPAAAPAPPTRGTQPEPTPWVYHRWEDMTMAERRAHFGYKSEAPSGNDAAPDAPGFTPPADPA